VNPSGWTKGSSLHFSIGCVIAFFHNYPILASLVVLVASLVVGAIELEMINLKPAAWSTWFIGGLALIAPLGASSYPTPVKYLLVVIFLAAYGYGIRFVLKNQSPG
jgi:hypothetical protein